MTFESAFLPRCLKRGRSLQFAANWLSFEILRPVNPFKLEVHSETTWPTPKCRHLAQCASFLLLGFWLSMATEKASRLMLVEQRPMMPLGASCLHLSSPNTVTCLWGRLIIQGFCPLEHIFTSAPRTSSSLPRMSDFTRPSFQNPFFKVLSCIDTISPS